MTPEEQKPQQEEGEIKKSVEKGEGKEKDVSPEQALLEAQRLAEEMEKHCEEVTARLVAEGKDAGLNSKEIRDFKDEIEVTLANLGEAKKAFEEEIANLEAQLPLAEFTPSINKEEIAGKIEEIGIKKGDIGRVESEIKRSKEKISTKKETVLSKEREAQKEKEKKLKKASVEIEKVVLGKIHGSEASKEKDERSGSFSDESVQKVNDQYYDRFSNALWETQPEIVQEIIQKRLQENPNLDKGFRPSAELRSQQAAFEKSKDKLKPGQMKEVEEGLKKKEELEKSRGLFDADSFETLLREGKVDIEKLCDNLAAGINIFKAEYLDNAENTRYDALFMPNMVMEKVIENMSDEDMFKAAGVRANRIEETIQKRDFSDYSKDKKIADLYFNFTSHPKFNERLFSNNSELYHKRDEYWEQNYKKSFHQVVALGDNYDVKNTIEASDWATQRRGAGYGEVDKGKAIIDQISAERENLLKKVQAEKDKLREYEQKIEEATKQGEYAAALALIEEVSKMELEKGAAYSGIEGKLRELEQSEEEQRKQMEKISIDKIDRINIKNDYDKNVEKEYLYKTLDFIRRADIFNQRVTRLEIDKRKPAISQEGEEKKSRQKQETVELSRQNLEKKQNIVEKQKEQIYEKAAEDLAKEMSLPNLKMDWTVLEGPVKKIYEESNMSQLVAKADKTNAWLEEIKKRENSGGIEFKGLFKKTAKIKNPDTEEEEMDKVHFDELRKKEGTRLEEIQNKVWQVRRDLNKNLAEKLKGYYDQITSQLKESIKKRDAFLAGFEQENQWKIKSKFEEKYLPYSTGEKHRFELLTEGVWGKGEPSIDLDFKEQWENNNIQEAIRQTEYKKLFT